MQDCGEGLNEVGAIKSQVLKEVSHPRPRTLIQGYNRGSAGALAYQSNY